MTKLSILGEKRHRGTLRKMSNLSYSHWQNLRPISRSVPKINKPAPEVIYEVVSELAGLRYEARNVKPMIRDNAFAPARLNQESPPPDSSWFMFDAKLGIERDHCVEADEDSCVASLNSLLYKLEERAWQAQKKLFSCV